MRILDINDVEMKSPDLKFGYLKDDKIFVAHHEEICAIEERGHYEVIAEYPNGGKDVAWIIDVEGVDGKEAWDEYEHIQRYIKYTDEELTAIEYERNKPSLEDRINALELALLEMLGVTIND